MSLFNFNAASTATEDTAYTFTVTPKAALTAGHTVEWEIIPDGKLPAGFGDFGALSGRITFAKGAGIGDSQTILLPILNDGLREYAKTFSLHLTQINGDEKVQIGEDQQITLKDDDAAGEFASINLASSIQHDTLVAGSSYEYRSFSGSGGDDTMIITRFQTDDITINDINGQNIIKFDHGVAITDVEQDVFEVIAAGIRIVNSITITLATGSVITITDPDSGAVGSKRYSFQIGDGVLTDYADFYDAITGGGFADGGTGALSKPFNIADPVAGDGTVPTGALFTASSSDTATEGLSDTATEGTAYEFTITPNAALTAEYRVRWDIILDGQLPAGFNDFTTLSGVVTFANGADVGQTITLPIIDDTARGDVKTFSVRLTLVDDDNKDVQIIANQQVTLTDNDTGEFAKIPLYTSSDKKILHYSSDQHDTLVAGSSYTYESFTGGKGNDTMIITRFQTGDIEINDKHGQNIIKFDRGVNITEVEENTTFNNKGEPTIPSIKITLDTGAVITISDPDIDAGAVGSGKRYSFQIEDGALTNYADFYAAISRTSNDNITGTASDDTFIGHSGDETLKGLGGDDKIYGIAGDDILQGHAGNDTLDGGEGNDKLYGGLNIDKLYGGAGNDELYGGSNNDELYGGEGNDLLRGHLDDDELYGGKGNDELSGGAGNDELTGGVGKDKFVLSLTNTGKDTVTDFEIGDDKIRIYTKNENKETLVDFEIEIANKNADNPSGSNHSGILDVVISSNNNVLMVLEDLVLEDFEDGILDFDTYFEVSLVP